MEPDLLLALAAGYAIKAFSETTISGLLKEFGSWLKKKVFQKKDLPQKLSHHPEDEDLQIALIAELKNALVDQQFARELQEKVEQLQSAGIKEKNIVRGALKGIEGNVHIGDKNPPAGEDYDRKNIVEGQVKKLKGDFRLGDDYDA